MWVVQEEFLTQEDYVQCSDRGQTVIQQKDWSHAKSRLCALYLIEKVEWAGQGNSALPDPFLRKKKLLLGARPVTWLVRYLCDEIPCSFWGHVTKVPASYLCPQHQNYLPVLGGLGYAPGGGARVQSLTPTPLKHFGP